MEEHMHLLEKIVLDYLQKRYLDSMIVSMGIPPNAFEKVYIKDIHQLEYILEALEIRGYVHVTKRGTEGVLRAPFITLTEKALNRFNFE